ncbi:MAG: hypothetical protein JNJ59_14075 [Deltaproteobacteria bacterium]|jgi:uncharacterized repeat protein (TIGR01451 family)|nr:hypothetical protein [Deltaproteobacteria bacterium]
MILKTLTALALMTLAPSAMAAADLKTTLTTSPSTALVYSTARYTVTVANIGNKNATSSTVRIDLPATHTSPQVYVLGTLGAKSPSCTQTGTRLDCALGTINKGTSTSVFFDIALPVSTSPFVFTATAATPVAENSTSNNVASRTAAQSFYATTVGAPVTMNNSHCTGTGLTSYYECTRFPSSISTHQAVFNADGSISIPGQPDYTGQWTVTATPSGSFLEFYYEELGAGVAIEFEGWGSSASCFEGLSTFPGSTYVSPYKVCP